MTIYLLEEDKEFQLGQRREKKMKDDVFSMSLSSAFHFCILHSFCTVVSFLSVNEVLSPRKKGQETL